MISRDFSKLTELELDLLASLCKLSLYDFLTTLWSSIDPAEYVDDWHIKETCYQLQRLWSGEITRLIINMPPRCLKSMTCSVFFPVWGWVNDPSTKFLTGSYSQQLATRDTTKARHLIQSEVFQTLYPGLIEFSSDQNQKTYYSNTRHGDRISFSIEGTITGAGGDIIILDDPQNADDANSQVKRDSVNRFFSESLLTRLNNQRTGRILAIMQRLHENDLTGYLLKTQPGVWTHLCFPMRYEGAKNKYDKRKRVGQILTKRHTKKTLDALEAGLGPYATAGQHQQRPMPREGGSIKLEWMQYYTHLPSVKRWSWSWDTAIKKGQNNDYSVGLLWAECDNGYYLVDMWRKKVEYPELRNAVKLCYQSQRSSEVIVEDKASGQQIIQDFRRIGNMPIIPVVPGKDMPLTKDERVNIVSTLFEAGKVFLPQNKPWTRDVVAEFTNFPNATHDDIVDSMTQYLAKRLSGREVKVTVI